MADFLTRLASRTLGLAPVAEPVITPMFAPDPSLPAMAGSDEALDALQQAPQPAEKWGALPPVSSPEGIVRPVAPRPRPDPIEWPALLATEARLTQPSAGETTLHTAMTASVAAIVGDVPARRRRQLSPEASSETAGENALLMPPADDSERLLLPKASAAAETPLAMLLPARPDSSDSSRTQATWTEEPLAASSRSAVRQERTAPLSWDVEPDEPLLLPRNPAEAPSMRRDARGRGRCAGR